MLTQSKTRPLVSNRVRFLFILQAPHPGKIRASGISKPTKGFTAFLCLVLLQQIDYSQGIRLSTQTVLKLLRIILTRSV